MRTKFDPNEIIHYDDHAEIVLYDQKNREKARTSIDLDCLPFVESVKWYLRPDGYVATNNYRGEGYAYLHSTICPRAYSFLCVDHVDGNRLNNRLNNLRVVTSSENGANKRVRSNNTSGRVGVCWDKSRSKWCASICVAGKNISLGKFADFAAAVSARQSAEVKYFGEYKPQEMRLNREVGI